MDGRADKLAGLGRCADTRIYLPVALYITVAFSLQDLGKR